MTAEPLAYEVVPLLVCDHDLYRCTPRVRRCQGCRGDGTRTGKPITTVEVCTAVDDATGDDETVWREVDA